MRKEANGTSDTHAIRKTRERQEMKIQTETGDERERNRR